MFKKEKIEKFENELKNRINQGAKYEIMKLYNDVKIIFNKLKTHKEIIKEIMKEDFLFEKLYPEIHYMQRTDILKQILQSENDKYILFDKIIKEVTKSKELIKEKDEQILNLQELLEKNKIEIQEKEKIIENYSSTTSKNNSSAKSARKNKKSIEESTTSIKTKDETDDTADHLLNIKNLEKILLDYRNLVQKSSKTQISSVQLYKSAGLKNRGNTCYINSVIQVLTYMDELNFVSNDSPLLNNLYYIILSLKDPKYREYLDQCYENFTNQLYSQDDDFVKNKEGDPKYLLIFIQKELYKVLNFSLFRWSKKITYSHPNPYSFSHKGEYPESINLIFNLPLDQGYKQISKKNVNIFLSDYFGSMKKSSAHCEKCNTTRDVTEESKISDYCPYIIFCLSEAGYSAQLSQMMEICVSSCRLILHSIILRTVLSNNSAHITSICKDNNSWVEYNDEKVSEFKQNQLNDVYILIYKFTKI